MIIAVTSANESRRPSVRRDRVLGLMERLDPTYASLKKLSKDAALPEAERSDATARLADRESTLAPTFKQIALLYADLHE